MELSIGITVGLLTRLSIVVGVFLKYLSESLHVFFLTNFAALRLLFSYRSLLI